MINLALLDLLKNGTVPQGITHIVGPPNSGKTTLIYQTCRSLNGRKALFFDCEINFSAQRLKEINLNYEVELNDITVISIFDKNQQIKTLMKIHNFIPNTNYAFIAVNGITDHFRFRSSQINEMSLHRLLTLQMAYLNMISKEYQIPILITNQVTAFREKEKKIIRPVANSAIMNYSDREIRLRNINKKLWKAKQEREEVLYKVTNEGIEIIESSF
ncbi:MAG: DNA repair and recombination protein RadB [Candidatus Heimdallarchaeota archaeon AB_125]|nr:MAG: DNA repair and recombination protein RadB [Candidatus Heimdallarchaeota archaeon AB_125]